jgi:hypothetical protein
MKRKDAGMSFIEVLIASVIFVAVVSVAMSILHSTSRTAANGSLVTQLEQRASRTLTFFQDQLSTAAFVYNPVAPATLPTVLGIVPGTSNTAFGYQLCGPATVAPSGSTYVMNFGYPDPKTALFNTNLVCFIRFEADTVLQESSSGAINPTQTANWAWPTLKSYPTPLVTKVLNMELNKNNGLRSETFVRGKIMKYIVNKTTGATVDSERLDDMVLLRVTSTSPGAFSGDIDGDGTADPLFTFLTEAGATIPDNTTIATAARVQINLWHAIEDDNGKSYILRNNKLIIHLRTERAN